MMAAAMDSDTNSKKPVTIHRFPGFAELYEDTGIPEAKAPRSKENVKFRTAIEQFDDDDLRAIREYDRARSGGIVNG
jgi:hypothetical protein